MWHSLVFKEQDKSSNGLFSGSAQMSWNLLLHKAIGKMSATTQASITVYKPPESRGGTITSWIPLITPYSILPECTSALMRWDTAEAVIAFDPGFGISVDHRSQCGPKAVTAWWDQDRLGPNIETITSLGPLLACPEPYVQVATSVLDASSTLVGCCPSSVALRHFQDHLP